ncbi:MAG: hypothetical protein HOY78_26120, partial [Saccharothrix sp.]|nr:hypothetical protein [Saccharothrix sp.]
MAGRRRLHVVLLAGWLFADLFLVLFIVGLESTPGAGAASSSASATTTTTTTTTTPTTTTTVAERVLDRTPVKFEVEADLDRLGAEGPDGPVAAGVLDAVSREVAARGPGRAVGFVLIFAAGPQDGIAQAQDRARTVLGVLQWHGRLALT